MTKVSVGVIYRNGTVLLCQRKQGARYGLKWEFPGGKLEPGETALEGLRRELLEELSITVGEVDRMEIQTAHYADGGDFEVVYCLLSSFKGEPKNNVFEQIRWVTVDELRSMDILEGNRAFVDQLSLPRPK